MTLSFTKLFDLHITSPATSRPFKTEQSITEGMVVVDDSNGWRTDANVGIVARYVFRNTPAAAQCYDNLISSNLSNLQEVLTAYSPITDDIETYFASVALGQVAIATENPDLIFNAPPFKYGNGAAHREFAANMAIVNAVFLGHVSQCETIFQRYVPSATTLAWSLIFSEERNQTTTYDFRRMLESRSTQDDDFGKSAKLALEVEDIVKSIWESASWGDPAASLENELKTYSDDIILYRSALAAIELGHPKEFKTIIESYKTAIKYLPDLLAFALVQNKPEIASDVISRLTSVDLFAESTALGQKPSSQGPNYHDIIVEVFFFLIDQVNKTALNLFFSLSQNILEPINYTEILSYAVSRNSEDIVAQILELCPHPSPTGSDNYISLCMCKAIEEGYYLSLDAFLNSCQINFSERTLEDLLESALKTKNLSVLQEVIKFCNAQGLSADACASSMCFAVSENYLDGYKLLLAEAHKIIDANPELGLSDRGLSRIEDGLCDAIQKRFEGFSVAYLEKRFPNDGKAINTAFSVCPYGREHEFSRFYPLATEDTKSATFRKIAIESRSLPVATMFFSYGFSDSNTITDFYRKLPYIVLSFSECEGGVLEGLKHVQDAHDLEDPFYELCRVRENTNPEEGLDKVISAYLEAGVSSSVSDLAQAVKDDNVDRVRNLMSYIGPSILVTRVLEHSLDSDSNGVLALVVSNHDEIDQRNYLLIKALKKNNTTALTLLDDETLLLSGREEYSISELDDSTLVAALAIFNRSGLLEGVISVADQNKHKEFLMKAQGFQGTNPPPTNEI